jgi:hypothetical protein
MAGMLGGVWHNAPKGGWGTGVGGPAPVIQTVGSLLRTHTRMETFFCEKGLSVAPVSYITWSIFKLHKWFTPFLNP